MRERESQPAKVSPVILENVCTCMENRKQAHKMHRMADIVTCHGLLIRQCYFFSLNTLAHSLTDSLFLSSCCVFAVHVYCRPFLVIIIPEHTHFPSITFVCIVFVCVWFVRNMHGQIFDFVPYSHNIDYFQWHQVLCLCVCGVGVGVYLRLYIHVHTMACLPISFRLPVWPSFIDPRWVPSIDR